MKKRYRPVALRLAIAAAVTAGPAACSGLEPAPYTELHEIPDGPGLLSGTQGEFTWVRDRKKPDEEND